MRVVLTNAFGTQPLVIGGAQVARRGTGSSIVASSNRALTFGGLKTATIPPAAILVSDAVDLRLNINNIFDELYYDKPYTNHMAGVAPGRVALLTTNFKF